MKYCPHCNQPVTTKGKICPECGKPLKGSGPESFTNTLSPNPGQQQQKSCSCAAFLLIIIIFIAAAVIILLAVTYITDRKKPERPSHSISEDSSVPDQVLTAPPAFSGSPSGGSADSSEDASTVTLRDYSMTKNLFMEDVLTVALDYYNGSTANQRFMTKYKVQVFQDGVSCMETVVTTDYSMNITAEIQPGAAATVEAAFVIKPDKELQLVVTDFRSNATVLDTIIQPSETLS